MSVSIFGMPRSHPHANQAVQLAEEFNLLFGIPVDALAAISQLFQQGAKGDETLVRGRVVTFYQQ
jgi:hypothetical protein